MDSNNREEHDIVSVFIEIRPLLQIANVFIGSPKSANNLENSSVKFQGSSITITMKSGTSDTEVRRHLKIKDLFFKPTTCSTTHQNANGCYFRVQIHIVEEDELQKLLNVNDDTKCKFRSVGAYDGVCVQCGAEILYPQFVFGRVMPLPPDSMQVSSATWFCHNHEGISDTAEPLINLNPDDDECFVGEDYVLLNSRVINLAQIKSNQETIRCRRCLQYLGDVLPCRSDDPVPIFKLFTSLFKLKSSTESSSSPEDNQPIKSVVTSLLMKQFRKLSRRLYITNKDDSSCPALLVWLMDCGLLHVAVDLLKESTEVQPQQVMKILYNPQEQESRLHEQWKTDISVHHMPVIADLFVGLMDVFTRSTQTLVPFLQKVDDFWVAYLPISFENNIN